MTRLGFLERKLHDEREKALDAARAAVVEATKAWLYAGKDEAAEAATMLAVAIASLERLESTDA